MFLATHAFDVIVCNSLKRDPGAETWVLKCDLFLFYFRPCVGEHCQTGGAGDGKTGFEYLHSNFHSLML
jgi:hypothetical protein